MAVRKEAASYNPNHVTPQQYFCPSPGAQSVLYDIGRPKVMTTKVKTFKARLWICRDYPLSLKDQIIPIIDLIPWSIVLKFEKFKTAPLQLQAEARMRMSKPEFGIQDRSSLP
ncbi:unnamed protein product [Trichobilharzia regenti]|nr:unnamed protein product [Trichobilharzia regenti]